MNLHIIMNQKFTEKFTDFIDQNYPLNSNLVYVYGNEKYITQKKRCVQYITDLNKEVDFSLLGENDKFFVHGFFEQQTILFLYRHLNRFKPKQLVLIIWGAELYNAHYILSDGKLHLRVRFLEFLKRKIIRKANVFMTFASPDFRLAQQWYGARGKQFDCLYPSNAEESLLNDLKTRENEKDKIRILLGNSATSTNQHIPMLDVLKKFSAENIEIICPLSYGDMEYGTQVETYGKQQFGEKFVAVKEYMSPDKYAELLNRVQIAVFNNNRQQGTGNIEILAYLGKKIYLRSDTTTWEHYVQRDHCFFYDTKKIPEMTFKEFVNFSDAAKNANEEYFKQIWNIKYIKHLWDQVMKY